MFSTATYIDLCLIQGFFHECFPKGTYIVLGLQSIWRILIYTRAFSIYNRSLHITSDIWMRSRYRKFEYSVMEDKPNILIFILGIILIGMMVFKFSNDPESNMKLRGIKRTFIWNGVFQSRLGILTAALVYLWCDRIADYAQ
jgi:hypothetical protein